jgi:hypothetical protein
MKRFKKTAFQHQIGFREIYKAQLLKRRSRETIFLETPFPETLF